MNGLNGDHGCLLTAGWPAAARAIRPTLVAGARPARPLLSDGPAGLAVAYVLAADGAEIQVSTDHLRAWGVSPGDVEAAAMSNLASWSESAGWVDEIDGQRHLVWSEAGDGLDAARILLVGVRRRLARELGPRGRVLVAVPERDLLIATGAPSSDRAFEALFADYVAGRAQAAAQPIDSRVFELREGELVESRIAPD